MWKLALEMADGNQQHALKILEVALANLNKLDGSDMDEPVIQSNAGTIDEGKNVIESGAGALDDGMEKGNSSSADVCHEHAIVECTDGVVAKSTTLEIGCRVATKGLPGYIRFVSCFLIPVRTC